jgi:formylaminopyrimidine deformylase / aminopyrimidine aminohydrolase
VKLRDFGDRQVEKNQERWDWMLGHPLLHQMRDGTIDDDTFFCWMRQDYLFVQSAIPFLAALIPRGPASHWQPLARAIGTLEREIRLFEEQAGNLGVSLEGAKPSRTVHAFNQFLLDTAQRSSYEEAYAGLYAAHRATHESFKFVKSGLSPDSPVKPFVKNWAGREFGFYLGYLGHELDGLAAEADPETLAGMAATFERVIHHEIAFFDAALAGDDWPSAEVSGTAYDPSAATES